MKLEEALPALVSDLEAALVSVGRGDLLEQVKLATLERWAYDDFSDTTYLYLSASPVDTLHLDRLSLFDELGINLDCDARGRLCGIEVLDGKSVASLLGGASAQPPG